MTNVYLSHEEKWAPRKVKALNACSWIKSAFYLFKKQPLLWIIFWLITFVLSLVANWAFMIISSSTFLGWLANFFIQQTLMGGVVLAANKRERDEEVDIGDLFTAFSHDWKAFLHLTLIYLLALLFIFLAMVGIMLSLGLGGEVVLSMLGHLLGDINQLPMHRLMASATSGIVVALCVLLIALCFGLISTLFYFAPALIVLAEQKPFDAVKASFRAIWTNWLAFLVFSILSALLFIIGMLPLMLGWLIVIPVITLSNYTAWKDIFSQ